MISRSRSAPTAAAMSIECTTSANSTVTCLYSADRLTWVTGAPHSLQNLEFRGSTVPHDAHDSPGAVSPPSPLVSTSVSFHCSSAMSGILLCHLGDEVSRPSSVGYFEMAFSSAGPHTRSDDRWWSTRGQPSALARGEPGSDRSILEAYALLHVSNRRGAQVQHEHTEHVAASPDAVYAAISNVANLPRFVPQMIGVRPAGEGRVQVDARYEGHEQHGEASFHADPAD